MTPPVTPSGTCPVAHTGAAGVATDLDPFGPTYRADPYPVFRRAREDTGVHYNPDLDFWVVTRHAEVKAVLRDTRNFSADVANKPVFPLDPQVVARLGEHGFRPTSVLADNDPPNHVRVRRQVNKALDARRMLALEDDVRELTRRHLDAVAGQEEIEFVSALAWPVPALVLFRLCGLEDDALVLIKQGSADRVTLNTGRPTQAEGLNAAEGLGRFWRYCQDLIDSRLAEPRADFPSDLIQAGEQVDAPLDRGELVTVMYSILFAGHETTTGHLTHLLARVLAEPGLWDRLRAARADGDGPDLFTGTVEESLRIDPPVIGWRRRAKNAVDVGGVTVPENARLLLMLGSANHDDAVFADPEDFDVARRNARANLTFGAGEHLCLGAPLARLEGRVVLEEMVDRFPAAALPAQELEFLPSAVFRNPTALRIRTGDGAR